MSNVRLVKGLDACHIDVCESPVAEDEGYFKVRISASEIDVGQPSREIENASEWPQTEQGRPRSAQRRVGSRSLGSLMSLAISMLAGTRNGRTNGRA